MAKKKSATTGKKMGRPPGRKRVPLPLRVKPELKQALEQLAEQTRRTITTEVEIALEKHLKDHELWPPPESQAEDS